MPTFLAFFNAQAAANAGNAAAYTGTNWTNATFLGYLATQNPNPFGFASAGTNGLMGNATLRDNAARAGIPANFFVANPDRMDRERITRFLSAVERGTQFMLNHPEEAREVFAAHAPDLSDELNTQAWADTFGRFALSPAALDQGRYRRFEQFLLHAGLIDEAWPVDRIALDPGAGE